MNKTFKVICFLVLATVLATCLFVFSGCDSKANGLKIKVNNEEQSITLGEKETDVWYADLNLAPNSQVVLYDADGKAHNITVTDGGNYTLFLKKNGGTYEVEARKEKKAVLWVTALLSGGLYDQEKEEAVWDPLPFDDVLLRDFLTPEKMTVNGTNLISRILFSGEMRLADILDPIVRNEQDETNLLWNLSFDHNGNPNNPNIMPANGFDNKVQYGVLGAYTDHNDNINATLEKFGMEFHVFNYDWRKDCAEGADALADYIDENKYTDVVLFSHSMGGNVVASYLAKSEFNRSRVSGYVSMGGAFLGSFDALYTMENLSTYFEGAVKAMGMGDLLESFSGVLKYIKTDALFEQLQDFIISLDTFVQLLPSYDLISGPQYGENGDGVAFTIDGVAIESKEDLYSFYESRSWAWQKDENGEYVMDGDKHVIRDIVKNLSNFHDSLFVTLESGERVFSTTLVDTYYVIGKEIVTYCGADLDTETDTFTFRTTKKGDMQVLYYSALANLDDQKLLDEGKLIVFPEYNHFQVGCDWELIKETTYNCIATLFGLEIE